MAVNKNPGSRDDNRGSHRGPERDRFGNVAASRQPIGGDFERARGAAEIENEPSRDRDSEEYWTGESTAKAKARSLEEESSREVDLTKKAHPNRVTGNAGRKGR